MMDSAPTEKDFPQLLAESIVARGTCAKESEGLYVIELVRAHYRVDLCMPELLCGIPLFATSFAKNPGASEYIVFYWTFTDSARSWVSNGFHEQELANKYIEMYKNVNIEFYRCE